MSMSLPLRDRWKERWENESLVWTIGSRTRRIPFTWSNIRLCCYTAWTTDVTLRSALGLAQPLLSATRSQKKRAATLDESQRAFTPHSQYYHKAKSTRCNCLSPQIIFCSSPQNWRSKGLDYLTSQNSTGPTNSEISGVSLSMGHKEPVICAFSKSGLVLYFVPA